MTGKRFEYNHEKGYNDYIYDVTDNRMMWNLECICELLNSLNDENEQLKQRIQLLSSLLDLADIIIDLSDDDKSKTFWEKRNNEVEQKWEEIVKNGDM